MVPTTESVAETPDALLQQVRSLAHDVNNVLQVAMLAIHGSNGANSKEALAALSEAAELTRELLHLGAKPPSGEREPLLLTPVIQAAVARLAPLLGEHVSVESHFDAVDARAHVDASTIHQAVRNLALNARAAMPNGGRLSVELTESVVDGTEVVQLIVCDEGHGVDEGVMANLGGTQRSARPGGHGLGLALLTSRLESCGGELTLFRRDEGGTRAVVVLPKASPTKLPDA